MLLTLSRHLFFKETFNNTIQLVSLLWIQSQLSSISVHFLFQSATWTLPEDICRQMPPLSQSRESESLHLLVLGLLSVVIDT